MFAEVRTTMRSLEFQRLNHLKYSCTLRDKVGVGIIKSFKGSSLSDVSIHNNVSMDATMAIVNPTIHNPRRKWIQWQKMKTVLKIPPLYRALKTYQMLRTDEIFPVENGGIFHSIQFLRQPSLKLRE
ncbi:MAG: hypothetical protein IPI90_10610 [Saprospiraceae bacterium]|nr:hypothetical protein [Candidatus Vicinibacter affinis]